MDAHPVRRVMLCVNRHTPLDINAFAADTAKSWRQWAQQACDRSAGAGHAFTKSGIDGDEPAALAGPGLLVKQMEMWLPLWLDGRRAAAKQLADQECWG